jgi:hypothetical protein
MHYTVQSLDAQFAMDAAGAQAYRTFFNDQCVTRLNVADNSVVRTCFSPASTTQTFTRTGFPTGALVSSAGGCLAALSGATGAETRFTTCSSSAALQQWFFEGFWIKLPAFDFKCLDFGLNARQNLYIFNCNRGGSQTWIPLAPGECYAATVHSPMYEFFGVALGVALVM